MSNTSVDSLIDSSVLITYLRGNRAIIARLDALPNKHVTSIVIGELAYGAHRALNAAAALRDLATLLGPLPVVDMGLDVGYSFADIKSSLASANQLIPDNDIWIAVTAMAHGPTVVTRDAHFGRIAPFGLDVEQ